MMREQKILEIAWESRKIKFRDTYNYLNFSLDKFDGAFGLGGITKGTFPFMLNRADKQDYNGPFPELQ